MSNSIVTLSAGTAPTKRSIVFITADVQNYDTLLAGLGNDVDVYVLNAQQDGIFQIASILHGVSGLDSIHILSHGSSGSLSLGSSVLNNTNIADYSAALNQIGSSLSETGDILLYGCNVAQGNIGQQFINQLSLLAGADIAASDDLTGAANQGGDWVLEANTGTIEANVISAETWQDTLAISQLGTYNTVGTATAVAVAGNYAYIADGASGLSVVDISNPSSPILTGSNTTGFNNAKNIAVSGNYAYIASGAGATGGLKIVNIATPASPTVTGTWTTTNCSDVAISGNYALLATGASNSFRVLDVTNKAAPVSVSSFATTGAALSVADGGNNYAYVIDSNGLEILNITTLASPTLAGQYLISGATTVSISGSYAYVTDSTGLLVINIATPASPTLAGQYAVTGATSVSVSGTFAYITTGATGVVRVNISNPASPTLVDSYNTAGTATGAFVSGSMIYVADGTSGLQIVTTNVAPTATNLSAAVAYTEDTAINWASDIVITDADSTTVTATLTLSNAAAGSLSTATAGATTSTYNAGTGVWSASGSKANVNSLLAGVIFTPTLNFNGNFTIATSVSDGIAAAITGSKAFTGTAVNDAPTATNNTLVFNEDTVYTFSAANFGYADVDGNAMASVTITSLPTVGTLKLSGTAVTLNQVITTANIPNLTFTPVADANGTGYANFNFTVNDGTLNSVSANTITFNVSAVNDAPTASNLSSSESYTEDTALNLTDIVSSDIDSANITVTLTLSNTAAGSLSTATSGAVTSTYNAGTGLWLASGAIADVNTLLAGVTFTPTSNFNGNFSIATSVSDGIAPAITGSKSFTGAAVNDAPTGSVTISGTVSLNSQLTAVTNSIVDADGLAGVVFAYQWQADGVDIAGAINSTYNISAGEVGKTIRVVVHFTDQGGTPETLTSNSTSVVSSSNAAPTGLPTISGTVSQNQILTADISGIADTDGLTGVVFNYQWQANGVDIVGATSSTYSLSQAEVGKVISVAVSYIDQGGTAELLTSATTAVVANINDAPVGTAIVTLVTGTEDITYTIKASDLLQGFSDIDGDTLTVANLAANHGVLVDNLDGTWTFTPTANYNGAVALTYNVIDGHGGSVAATQSFNLATANDAPTGTASATLANGTEDIAYTINASALLQGFNDIDGDTLSIANLAATNGVIVDNLDGTWTFTPTTNYNGAVSLSYNIIDGHGGSVAATQSFHLAASNDAPTGTASAILASGVEDAAYTINASALLQGFSDIDGDTLSVVNLSATNGVIVDNLDGTWTFTPTANYNGAVSLSYNVIDGNGGSVAGTQSFNLAATNDAPTGTASATLANGNAGTAYTINTSDLLQGFSDIDGDTLSIAGLSATNGTLVDNTDGTWTFTPSANYNGAVTLTYNVIDGQGGSVAATQSFNLVVTNHAPTGTASAVLASGTEDTAYTINASVLLQGFSDIDGDTLSVASLNASNGTLTPIAGGWTFTPTANYNGAVTLTYNVIDGKGGSVAATQSFNIAASNDAPTGTASATLANGTEDTAYTINASDLLQGFSDIDGDTLSVASLTATNGTLTPIAGGWTFTPTANYNGAVALTYNIIDGNGGSVAATQSFHLAASNDAPTGSATATLANGNSGTAYTINTSALLQGFSDIDGDTLSISGLSATNGTLTPIVGGWTFTPNANYSGAVTLTYDVIDGQGSSVAATQSFNLVATNNAPTGTASAILASGTEDTAYTINASALLQGFSDIDGDTLSVASLNASNGTLTPAAGGWTFTPTANYNGAVALTYNVIDGQGGSVAATQSFHLAASNDAPTGSASAVLASGTEDTAYTINASALLQGFSDIDGDTLSIAGLTATNGTFTSNAGSWTFTPTANYNGVVSLTYNVIDGNGGSIVASQSFHLAASNDAPIGSASAVLANGNSSTAYTINTSALLQGFSDIDGDTLSISGLSATNGTLIPIADGWSFTANANYSGAVALTYDVIDGQGGSVAATQSFTLVATNNAPTGTASAILASGAEDTAHTINASALLQGFSDIDGDTLSIAGLSATNGTLIPIAGGWTFTPTANYNGAVALTYNVIDGKGGSIAATQGFSLAAINDAPTGTASAVLANGSVSTAYTINASALLQGFSDIDGDTLSVTSLTATNGSLVSIAGGWTFTPTANFNGAVALTYNVIDGNGGSIAATQSFNIPPPNNAATGGLITISGTSTQGQTLTVSNTLTDADGLGAISYQWLRSGNAINGATSSSYTLTQSDIGNAIAVKASYIDGHGTAESKTSNPTSSVIALPKATMANASVLVNESDSVAQITVTLDHALSSAASIEYTVKDSGAVSGRDFSATSGVINLQAGETSKVISIPIINDNWIERSSESFSVSLTKATGSVALGSSVATTVTIADDDFSNNANNLGSASLNALISKLKLDTLLSNSRDYEIVDLTTDADTGVTSAHVNLYGNLALTDTLSKLTLTSVANGLPNVSATKAVLDIPLDIQNNPADTTLVFPDISVDSIIQATALKYLPLSFSSLGNADLAISTGDVAITFKKELNVDINSLLQINDVPVVTDIIKFAETAVLGGISLKFTDITLSLNEEEITLATLLNGNPLSLTASISNPTDFVLSYELVNGIGFKTFAPDVDFIKDIGLTNAKFNIGKSGLDFFIDAYGEVDLGSIDNPITNFLHYVGIDTVSTYAAFHTTPATIVLESSIDGSVPLFPTLPAPLSDFKINLSDITMFANVDLGAKTPTATTAGTTTTTTTAAAATTTAAAGADTTTTTTKPKAGPVTVGVSAAITVEGYDLTQDKEPALVFTGGIYTDLTKSISVYGSLDADTPWINPFGLHGAEIRHLGLQIGGTDIPPFINNVGFVLDLTYGQYDIGAFFSASLTKPEFAFALTVNQEVNLAQFMADAGVALLANALPPPGNTVVSALLMQVTQLLDFIPLTIISVDSDDADFELDPIVKFAPTEVTVGTQTLSAGFGINGQINAFGHLGSLSINTNEDFSKISGFMKIGEIQIGDWLTISGTTAGSDLSFELSVSSTYQYLKANAKFVLFGETLARANVEIGQTYVKITDTSLGVSDALSLNIHTLSADLLGVSASGSADIVFLNHTLANVNFNFSPTHLSFAGNMDLGFLDINGSFDWNIATDSLAIAGSVSINGVNFASATIDYNQLDGLIVTSSLNVNVLGTSTSVSIMAHLNGNDWSISASAVLPIGGYVEFSVDASGFSVSGITSAFANLATNVVGDAVSWIDTTFSNIIDDLSHAGGDAPIKWQGGIGNEEKHGMGDADILFGNGGNDTIYGGDYKDKIDGGSGDDTLYGDGEFGDENDGVLNFDKGGIDEINGGDGNDTIEGNKGSDNLYGGNGNDTIHGEGHTSSPDQYDSSDDGYDDDDFIDGGTGDDKLYGDRGNDTIQGSGGNDILDGGTGVDSLSGGSGNDTYYVDDAGDTVVEASGEGVDTVYSTVTYTLSSNVENLTLTGTAAINGTGNSLANILTGNSGINTLTGLAGDDTYYVGSGDTVVEALNSGTDTVISSVTYTLAANVENLTLTGAAAINGMGNASNNVLTGNSGNNILTGLAGDDTYYVTSGDTVVEALNGGTDTVISSVTYTLAANVENLTLTGTDAINGTGNALNNAIVGNSAANILDGGIGVDTLKGGAGNDTYIVDNTGDVVSESVNKGTDLVKSSISYTLNDNVENLTLTGTTAINGTGNALNNAIVGNSAANILSGGLGKDTLTGGLGDDVYIIDNIDDVVTELSNAGTDSVKSSVSYTLNANVENLTLTGKSAIDSTGNALDNKLTGNDVANILDGGLGADTLTGMAGNDTYKVDNIGDVVIETSTLATEIDTVNSSITYTLGSNVENLTLIGTAVIDGTGNSLNNVLTGNNGINKLTGLGGNDTYYVGSGDTIVEVVGGGTDTVFSAVTYTLASNVENLTLIGTAAIDGTGNSSNNILTGNNGINKLTGLGGDDTYYVGSGDTVIEALNDGTDTVVSIVTYTLANNVENLTLTGTAAINGTGNSLNNTLTGNNSSNTMAGLGGDDVYYVDNSDTVVEAVNGGNDTVVSVVSYTLADNVENLTLSGAAAINGTGNALNNILMGNSGKNILTGLGGDDTYYVGSGDSVVEAAGGGIDTIVSSFTYTISDVDVENLTLTGTAAINGTGNNSANILIGNSGINILTGLGGNDTYYVGSGDSVVEAAGGGIDTVVSSLAYTITDADVENLILTGAAAINGTGNSSANTITGNSAANILDGGSGVDLLIGGKGDDTYIVDNTGDVVTELLNAGTDTVKSSATYTLSANVENLILTGTAAISGTGNGLKNSLTGNAAANTLNGGLGDDSLDGGVGADSLVGGSGNDVYFVDNSGDVVIETSTLAKEIDTVNSSVNFTLGANLENLTLTGTAANGTGNALDNILIGNAGANTLDGGVGDDLLDGGTGADSLIGGLGDDVYIVDNIGDVVTEQLNAGTDTVVSSINYTLGANLENLTLTGLAANGTGNTLDNVLTGNSGANILNGGVGADSLIGGLGNDIYSVDDVNDVVTESSSLATEIDTVNSSVNYILSANVENLTLTGTAAIDGTGNGLINVITGNGAANILDGGAEADSLIGGLGDDVYIVDNIGDVVIEQLNAGTDTVKSSASTYSLSAYVENLTLIGTAAINGTGNTLNNTLVGNEAANRLDGGIGADSLIGGLGDDVYVVDNVGDVVTELFNAGTDTVESSINYTLGANLENLTLTGIAAINGTGNELDNILTGNVAANRLIGGLGNDVYIVDNVGDVVIETSNLATEIDRVESSITYTLGANQENLTLTGIAVINGTGNALDNVLTGNAVANRLDGSTGADSLIGGLGDDVYVVDNIGDVVTEQSNAGTDKVESSISYTLAGNLENLTLTGTAAIDGTGNKLKNILTGNTAVNILDGGTGADSLIGGLGDDIYIVDNTGDAITEQLNAGTDLVYSSADTYTLSAYVENLTLTGTDAINGTGNTLNNVLTGNTAANKLDGGTGADSLIGGLGNDVYVVDNVGDVITELLNEGIDTVESSINYTLGANLENLTLTGTTVINGTGNELDNIITGNAAANTLTGDDGDDVLNGGVGADKLIGGLGNDVYVVDNIGDVITEDSTLATEIDRVESSITYTLGANLENLTLIGTAVINGTGNALDNVLTGNAVANKLDGGAGADSLIGGLGDDIYVVDNIGDVVTELSNAGTDKVESLISYTLTANVENLTLTGTAAIDGTGNELKNILIGNTAANKLDGGAGADNLTGGLGNDVYVVDNIGDVVIETSLLATEIDRVESSISYTLGLNLENLTLIGTAAINGTGNTLNNVLIGNAAANILNGGTGADNLSGGLGNDVYIVDNIGDVVTEDSTLATEIDRIESSITYTLGANLENLTLTGAAAINGTGNELDNILIGNAAANTLTGNAGDDVLNGGVGADKLIGGLGNDVYIVDNIGDVVVEDSTLATEIDRVESSITYTLGANLENLTLTGTAAISGTGNALDNILTGNAGANTLNGGAGADSLIGGLGNDVYIVDNIGDVITETSTNAKEIDRVESSISYTLAANLENLTLTGTAAIDGTGNAFDNVLTGNAGANKLDGGTGADSLIGGLGNDVYVVDNIGDVVTETSILTTEIDSVESSISYTLGTNLENLTLTGTDAINGTGNTLNNVLIGNTAANRLNGGAGADSLIGGLGNDVYFVDNIGDVVTETSTLATEIDTVNSSISYTLGANLENLTLIGTVAINGTGNELDNVLTGNVAANKLVGGLGNDVYIVDNIGDVVIEDSTLATEIDRVESSVTYTLGANLENLTLTGTAAISGTGNALDNILTGNAGANTLNGGAGADSLIGGLGNDVYVVDNIGDVITETSTNAKEIDRVESSISYTLTANLENLTLTGTAAIDGTGNAFDNVLTGNTGANKLDGGIGADSLIGGSGDDVYIVDNIGDVITELSNAGTDIVFSSAATYTLSAYVENLTLTGIDAINGAGNTLNNILIGNTGSNSLDGGAGADSLTGGLGSDIYVVDNIGDVVTELLNEGIDTVKSSISYTLGANLEKLILTGAALINGTGNELNNVLTGNAAANTLNGGIGDDILDGGKGGDRLIGGSGNDVYYVDDKTDVVVEDSTLATEIDSVESSIDYTLGANLENLTLMKKAGKGTGNALNNVITGNGEKNTLDGGIGADTLIGGLGDDVYVVDNIGDVVIEAPTLLARAKAKAKDIDKVESSISYTLGANLENLTLTGTAAIDGTGNELDNVLTGNVGANKLDGGTGADTLIGGLGNDIYTVDDINDVITELPNAGTDTVNSSAVAYTLSANVENLTLTGAEAIDGTGNELNNVLTGNAGANKLNGGVGADKLIGGLGNDVYVVDNIGDVIVEDSTLATEIDRVESSISYTLGANLENLTLTGTAVINGTGNALDNILTGNAAANRLDGSVGADSLIGGLGDDIYVVDNIGDVVTELSNAGTDKVESLISYTLTANVENLTLTGTAAIDGTGNELKNILIGNTAANKLDGGAGADNLTGGLGNDVYVVDNIGDVVIETSLLATEIDRVESSISYTLGLNLENLTLIGTAAINGTGNTLNNVLIGNAAANILNGGTGADNLSGGLGNDVYIVDNIGDVVTEDSTLATEIDRIESSITYTLGANLENLTLTGAAAINGTGNELNNVLIGNAAANTLTGNAGDDMLNGGVGADKLIGGLGNDVYVVDNIGDVVVEDSTLATEIDRVESSITYTLGANLENLTLTGTAAISGTGNALDNILTGNAGANTLNGGAGADSLIGGLGNDVYIVDNIGDVATELLNAGTDTVSSSVSYTLSANVENLTLTGTDAIDGTGNELKNVITGNAGANKLDGGIGADSFTGGLGNDIYVVDNIGDVVTETSLLATEIDRVESSISYTLGLNLENLTLTGTDAINGTGNTLNNVLIGNAAANTLNGGTGADNLSGGLGNDVYIVDNIGDVVTETSTLLTEIDTVNSSVNFILGANLENLTLTGIAAINGTGNELDNVLTGNAAANMLSGDAGADMLIGGLGNDYLIGGLGQDSYNLTETTAATDTLGVVTGDSLASVGNYDLATGFKLGISSSNATGVDKLDLDSSFIAANAVKVDGVDSGSILSHSINKGIISFDDIDNYTSPLVVTAANNFADVLGYLQANITGGNTVAFISEGNTFVFQDGGVTDTLVELVGVTASSINNTGLGAGAVWIA